MQQNSPSSSIQRTLSLLWLLIAAAVCVTPLVFSRAAPDAFRTPKDIVFQVFALAILAAGAGAALWSDSVASAIRTHRPAVMLALAITAWTAVAAMTSVKPVVSFAGPFTVFCFAVFFAAAVWVVRDRGLAAVLVVFIPAVVNAIVALLQVANIWSPWGPMDESIPSLRAPAFLGNPNEVGGFFVLPLIGSVAAAIAWRKKSLAVITVILIGGVVAGHSLTSLAAATAGLALFLVLPAARGIRKPLIGAIALIAIVMLLIPGSRERMRSLTRSLATANLSAITSQRAPAWAVAAVLFREHPLTGAGPGAFGAVYMSYKLQIDEQYPQWLDVSNLNFGEAHNEYLQLLAETGLPGLALFVAGLFLFGRLSFRRDAPQRERAPGDDRQAEFVRLFSLPAAIAFAVLALAHFPLHLTATMVPAVYLAAVSFAWSTRGSTR